MDPLSSQILYHDCVSVMFSRFTFFTETFVFCCCQVTKNVCSRYCITSAFSARSPCYLGSRRTATSERFHFRRTFPVVSSLRFWSKRGRLCCFSTFILIVAKTASFFFCTLSFCFPLIASSLFPVNADIPSLHELLPNSCFNPFVSGLKMSGSDLLIHAPLYHGFQLLTVPL